MPWTHRHMDSLSHCDFGNTGHLWVGPVPRGQLLPYKEGGAVTK